MSQTAKTTAACKCGTLRTKDCPGAARERESKPTATLILVSDHSLKVKWERGIQYSRPKYLTLNYTTWPLSTLKRRTIIRRASGLSETNRYIYNGRMVHRYPWWRTIKNLDHLKTGIQMVALYKDTVCCGNMNTDHYNFVNIWIPNFLKFGFPMVRRPTSFRPLEYQTSSVFRSPLFKTKEIQWGSENWRTGTKVMNTWLIVNWSVFQIVYYSDHGLNNGHYQASEYLTFLSVI